MLENIKNQAKKLVLYLIIFVMVTEVAMPPKQTAAATTYISIEDYIQKLVTATKLTVDSTAAQPYITAAIVGGLVTEGEFLDYKADITREDTALLTNRAEEILNGTSYDSTLFDQILSKKRISDLSKISKAKRDEVIKVFEKGIMVGNSNGTFMHSRSFDGQSKLTVGESKTILARLSSISKRKKISPDGQLIRTTKLPKNYKDYPYILAAFPNGFYEKEYHWPKDAISPVETSNSTLNGYPMKDVLNAYLDKWTGKVETNLKTRMNMSYKTVNAKWISTLAHTYYIYSGASDDAAQNKRKTDDIKEYLSAAKKNKLVVKGVCSVEPSVLYDAGTFYMRAYVKFKVVSALTMNSHQEVIYGSGITLDTLKKNKWYTMYVDMQLGTCNGSSDGEDFAVCVDYFY